MMISAKNTGPGRIKPPITTDGACCSTCREAAKLTLPTLTYYENGARIFCNKHGQGMNVEDICEQYRPRH